MAVKTFTDGTFTLDIPSIKLSATGTVTGTIEVPDPPKPNAKTALGVFGYRSDGSKYLAPAGTDPFGTHAYGGSQGWGTSGPFIPETVLVANIRPRGKDEPVTDAQGKSTAENILAGKLDPMYRDIARQIKAVDHDIIATHWHESLRSEFKPGEPTNIWSDCFIHAMDIFADEGVTNVKWYSCLMASQYVANTNSPDGGMTYHTQALLDRLDGVGADLYLTASSWDPNTDKEWGAFAGFAPTLNHALLEFALWSDPTHQDECFALVDEWYRDHPMWTALVGFFNLGDPKVVPPKKDGRIAPNGAAVWDDMARDPFYGRTA
jgi:hypothetical protein